MGDKDTRAGVSRSNPAIIDFLNDLHAPLDSGLARAFQAPLAHGIPAIMVGRAEGRFLSLLMQIIGANKVVEVGTLTAFSTIHLARGMSPNGHLWTVENEPHHVRVAHDNLIAAGLDSLVTVVHADGLAGLKTLEEEAPFDAVFIDADKGAYDKYAQWAALHLRAGGLLLVDNAYFFGQLLEASPEAASVRRMHIHLSDFFEATCLPTPEGMVLAIRR